MDGLYEISEQRYMAAFTTEGHITSMVEEAVAESMEHWYRYTSTATIYVLESRKHFEYCIKT